MFNFGWRSYEVISGIQKEFRAVQHFYWVTFWFICPLTYFKISTEWAASNINPANYDKCVIMMSIKVHQLYRKHHPAGRLWWWMRLCMSTDGFSNGFYTFSVLSSWGWPLIKSRKVHYIEKQMSHRLTLSDTAGNGWVKVFHSWIHCQNGFSMETRNSTCEGVVLMWILSRLHLRVRLLAVLCPGERDMMYTGLPRKQRVSRKSWPDSLCHNLSWAIKLQCICFS